LAASSGSRAGRRRQAAAPGRGGGLLPGAGAVAPRPVTRRIPHRTRISERALVLGKGVAPECADSAPCGPQRVQVLGARSEMRGFRANQKPPTRCDKPPTRCERTAHAATNRPHAATNRPRCERTAHAAKEPPTLRKNRPRCECENRPRSRRAASDPGLAQSGRAGGRLTGPVRVARTAGGATVCGCARTYVRKVICLGQTYLRFEIIGSSARRHNRTFVQFGLGPIWTFVERPFRPLAASLIFSV
jgi:hypothetical protein